jgi:hypothetical protein
MITLSPNRKQAIEFEVDMLEKEILYLTGKRRQQARKAYFTLLKSCGKTCGIDKPVYLKRT